MAESIMNNNDLDKKLDKALIQGLFQENEELKRKVESLEKEFEGFRQEFWDLYQENKTQREKIGSLEKDNEKLKQELIHYLGELKMLYTRQDSKRFCENKINELKRENRT